MMKKTGYGQNGLRRFFICLPGGTDDDPEHTLDKALCCGKENMQAFCHQVREISEQSTGA